MMATAVDTLRSAMRRAAWCLTLATGLVATAHAGVNETYVAVISVDGLGASELTTSKTCLPAKSTIRTLAAQGAVASGVSGVLPTTTYPSHATLVTGLYPVEHGVIDNGPRGGWFKNRSDIAADTLWDAARAAGMRVAIVTWPSSYGANVDFLVPEDLSPNLVATNDIRKGSTPGLFDSLSAAVGRPALLPYANEEAGTPLDAMTARFAAEIVRREKPHLLFTHFLDYDHRMHAGPYSPEACRALERIDAAVADIVDASRSAGILSRTTFFIVSDHGFLPVRKIVNPSSLLLAAGWEKRFPGVDVGRAFDIRVSGGSVAFYRAVRSPPDISERVASDVRSDVESRYGSVVRWITPSQARAFGGFPGAEFVLCARPRYAFGDFPPSRTDVFVRPRGAMGAHGYCPDVPEMDGVFIASGYGVRRTASLGPMAMIDVAPTIASFLSVKLPGATGRDHVARFRQRAAARVG